MPRVDDLIAVTVKLPRSIVERVDRRVAEHHSTREHQVAKLVESGLDAEMTWQERFDRLKTMHRERMQREGKLDQTEDEIWEELQRIRDQVANEYYPD